MSVHPFRSPEVDEADPARTGTAPTGHSALYDSLLVAAPVAGAVVTVLAGSTGVSTICFSDDTARKIDRLQVQLGQGPCWQAMSTRQPILTSNIHEKEDSEWPLFEAAILLDPDCAQIVGLFTFPLIAGSVAFGAVDLYSRRPIQLGNIERDRLGRAVDNVAWALLRKILSHTTTGPDDREPWAQHQIDDAVQVLKEDLNVSEPDGALLLRANAYATGRSVTEVAGEVVLGRVSFEANAR